MDTAQNPASWCRTLLHLSILFAFTGCALFPEESPAERQARRERRAMELEYRVKEQAERQEREAKARTESWLPGKLICLADGTVLPLRVEKVFAFGNSASGGISATHPKTGEKFSGQYSAVRDGGQQGYATLTSPTGQPLGTAQYRERSKNATAVATLTGDGGTIIQVQMQIVSGWSPHGVGSGTDNKGNQYQLQY